MPQGDFQPPTNSDGEIEMPQGGGPQGGPMGMDGDSSGADLVYSDDNRDSYSDIFDNEENDVSEDDEKELIAAIKALNSGKILNNTGTWTRSSATSSPIISC